MKMSELITRKKNGTKVGTRLTEIATPLHICLEINKPVPDNTRQQFLQETSLKVGNVLFVKNAP